MTLARFDTASEHADCKDHTSVEQAQSLLMTAIELANNGVKTRESGMLPEEMLAITRSKWRRRFRLYVGGK